MCLFSKQMHFLTKGFATLNFLHRIVDNMPVTWCYEVEDNQKFCNPGFPIGCYMTKDRHPKDACVISVSLKVAHEYVDEVTDVPVILSGVVSLFCM